MSYKKDDFKGCILDTYELPQKTDLLKTFPWLQKLPGFEYGFESFSNPDAARNSTIRFINYFYSQGIAAIENKFKDHWDRKRKF